MMVLPWLNPFAPGPSPVVVPFLFSSFCAAVLLGLALSKPASAERLVYIAAVSWLVAGLISSCMGLLQYFGIASELSGFINQTRYGEAFANLRQRNQFATLTNIALAALVWLMLQMQVSDNNTKRQMKHTLLAFAAAGLLAVGNAISSSRTGLFELLLICALCGFSYR